MRLFILILFVLLPVLILADDDNHGRSSSNNAITSRDWFGGPYQIDGYVEANENQFHLSESFFTRFKVYTIKLAGQTKRGLGVMMLIENIDSESEGVFDNASFSTKGNAKVDLSAINDLLEKYGYDLGLDDLLKANGIIHLSNPDIRTYAKKQKYNITFLIPIVDTPGGVRLLIEPGVSAIKRSAGYAIRSAEVEISNIEVDYGEGDPLEWPTDIDLGRIAANTLFERMVDKNFGFDIKVDGEEVDAAYYLGLDFQSPYFDMNVGASLDETGWIESGNLNIRAGSKNINGVIYYNYDSIGLRAHELGQDNFFKQFSQKTQDDIKDYILYFNLAMARQRVGVYFNGLTSNGNGVRLIAPFEVTPVVSTFKPRVNAVFGDKNNKFTIVIGENFMGSYRPQVNYTKGGSGVYLPASGLLGVNFVSSHVLGIEYARLNLGEYAISGGASVFVGNGGNELEGMKKPDRYAGEELQFHLTKMKQENNFIDFGIFYRRETYKRDDRSGPYVGSRFVIWFK